MSYISEGTLFRLTVHSWTDETPDGKVIFNEAMAQDKAGYCHKLKFESYYAAELNDKEAGDPFVVSELKLINRNEINEYGQLKEPV